VKVINTEGLTLIGPGSEWFWSALTGIVTAVTFLAIYRQLRLQSSAAAIDQMAAVDREWNAEPMIRARLEVMVALRNGVDPANLPPSVENIGNFWERLSILIDGGHVDRRIVHGPASQRIQAWWVWLTPIVDMWRVDEPHSWEGFERLAVLMGEMDRRLGRPPIDAAAAARTLPIAIAANTSALRIAEEMRAVIVRRPSTSSPAGGAVDQSTASEMSIGEAASG
jgi:hypothetical protein